MKNIVAFLFFSLSFGLIAQLNQVDAKGRKQGEWAKTYPGSKVYQYRGQFKDDKPVGTFTYFYFTTKVKALVKHDADGIRSLANMYHENGEIMSIGIYKNGQKDSVWMNFGPSGRLSNTETYFKDSLHGVKTVYFVSEDITDKRRIVAATYKYVNGKIDGEFKEYFDNGVVRKTGQYLNSRRHGEWISYQPNGYRLMLERFKNGQQHGWSLAYDDLGKESNRVYFYYGKKVEGKALEELMAKLKAKGINPNE